MSHRLCRMLREMMDKNERERERGREREGGRERGEREREVGGVYYIIISSCLTYVRFHF